VQEAMDQRGVGDLARLYRAADTWTVTDASAEGNGR
jgi:hypothetical protein